MKRQNPVYLHGAPWEIHEACPSCGRYFCGNLLHPVLYLIRWLKWFCYLNYIDPESIEELRRLMGGYFDKENKFR